MFPVYSVTYLPGCTCSRLQPLIRASQLIRDESCPGGAVDWATLGSTPSDQGLDVDVYPPCSHTRNNQLEKSFLDASEPRLIGVIEFRAI